MYKVYFLIKYIRKPILSNEIGYFYGFKPVFLVEKNKKTTSYAGGWQGF